jgi:hypothetical protein
VKPLTAAERWAEHCGDESYLASAVSASGDGNGLPPHPAPGVLTGRAEVESAPPCSLRSSLSPADIHKESERVRWMIANHNYRAAERERLEDLARGLVAP